MKAAIYARVSTAGQNPENQIAELQLVAERMNWDICEIYLDRGVSGAKDRESRTAFNNLYKAAMRKEFDLVMAWSVDRLGRSLQQLISFLSDIQSKNVELYLHQQGLDTTTPTGKAMFQLCGVFAEFERAIIRERVIAGLERARREGKILGRPKTNVSVEQKIIEQRKTGKGIKRIAKELGIGVSVVQRVISKITNK